MMGGMGGGMGAMGTGGTQGTFGGMGSGGMGGGMGSMGMDMMSAETEPEKDSLAPKGALSHSPCSKDSMDNNTQ